MNNPPTPPPVPFGDPTKVHQDNQAAVRKGIFFGCGGCGIAVACGVMFVIGIFAVVFFSLGHSDAATQSFARARDSKAVQARLGTPIEKGTMTSGSINVNGSQGNANVTIPISGPKGKGSIHAVAHKENGKWIFTVLTVSIEGSSMVIDLLQNLQASQQLLVHPIEAAVAEHHDHVAAAGA